MPPGGGRFDPYPYPYSIPARTPPGQQAAFPQIHSLAAPSQAYRLPSDNWANSVEGLRLHTLLEGAEMTALYWDAHQLNPTDFVIGHPAENKISNSSTLSSTTLGRTLNRPIYLFGETLSSILLVLRTEGLWQDVRHSALSIPRAIRL